MPHQRQAWGPIWWLVREPEFASGTKPIASRCPVAATKKETFNQRRERPLVIAPGGGVRYRTDALTSKNPK